MLLRAVLTLAPLWLVGACVPATLPVPAAQRVIPTGPAPTVVGPGFNRTEVEYDLLATARQRFGEAAVRRALGAPAYIFAKYYHGMLPPPRPGDPPYQPLMALLLRENGRWLEARADLGFQPVGAAKATEMAEIIGAPEFWSANEFAFPGCSDAGAAFVMLKLPSRPEIIRRGSCGETEATQKLVLRAVRP